jgi:hypothetical protein
MSQRDQDTLAEAQRRIDFVLNHPHMSAWLKDVVRTALDRNPVEVLNDLEILNQLLRVRCEVLAATALERPETSS